MTETKYPEASAAPMTGIAKNDIPQGIAAFDFPSSHPAVALWTDPENGFLVRLQSHLTTVAAHPARTVVVLPFAHLRPLASRLWAQTFPDGFAPRFETTMSWSTALGTPEPAPTDIRFDMAFDTLTAQELLTRAGMAAHAQALAGLLVLAAQQLGPLAAAAGPESRAQWAQMARLAVSQASSGGAGDAMQWEMLVSRVAIEWAAASNYASDTLFDANLIAASDCLVLVQGLMPDAIAQGLATAWSDKFVALPLDPGAAERDCSATGAIALQACRDSEDEAQRAAACAIAHIEAGRFPLALVSSDRALTRRVKAMLDGAGVQIRDENGWKLSTTSAAARVMAAFKACNWNASTDAVLAWLKVAPALATQLDALEAMLRKAQIRDWRHVVRYASAQKSAPLLAFCQQIEALRSRLQGRHTLVRWLAIAHDLLAQSGMLEALQNDGAGTQVLAVLRLMPEDAASFGDQATQGLWGERRLDLADFVQWVNAVLEDANFQPEYPDFEEVVIVPMSQMLARPFAALVLAGCDEVRLNPSPEPTGGWTPAQRLGLGLPAREVTEKALRAAWCGALQTPVCDVLWRTGDDSGETLLPSALVQLLQFERPDLALAQDPRGERTLQSAPVVPPAPQGAALPLRYWTQGTYEDLRQCPYRFFAMRQLGLQSVDELESEVDKRDFGVWLHEVLKRFHTAQQAGEADGVADGAAQRRALLDASAALTTESMALPEGEFLPFSAAWPAVRDGYLQWLADHEKDGARFDRAEVAQTQEIGELTLMGRLDRIDRAADGRSWVLDYKTENLAKTRSRTKEPLEDTQIAFYAALLPDDSLRGGYVNIAERGGTELVEQKDIVEARDALIEGLLADWSRIAQGAALPALGEGAACDFCQARGLCRKDFWSAP